MKYYWFPISLGVLFVAIAGLAASGPAPSCHPDSAQSAMPVQPVETWPPEVHVPIVVDEQMGKEDERTKTVLFKGLPINKIYKSMRGPWTRQYVSFADPRPGQFIWVSSYRAEIFDGENGKASQEFMCHTNMDLAGAAGTPQAFQRVRSELSISQGQKEVEFPRGFALKIPNTPETQADVNVMVLNNNYPDLNKKLDFKVTINYWDEKAAAARGLRPLFESAVSINCPTVESPLNQGDTLCETASAFLVATVGDHRTGHWLVPPGRHVYHMKAPHGLALPYDTSVHYIWMHVHPYAESMELRDLTTGRTVWKGDVKNDAHKAIVLVTDRYSSRQGMSLSKDHDYELISTYNNTTRDKIDAMAALWMYFDEEHPL